MPLKINFVYNQFAAGWTETFYLNSPTDPRSFCNGLNSTFFAKAVGFRAFGTQLYAVRASLVGFSRISFTRIIQFNADGPALDDPPDYTNPDIVSSDAVFQLIGTIGHKRNVSLRGLRDADTLRGPSGTFQPTSALNSQVQAYISALKTLNLAIRFEIRPPTTPLVWYPITSVSSVVGSNALTVLQLSGVPPLITTPIPLTIQGTPRDDLPGLPRNAVAISSDIVLNQITIQYRYRGHTPTVTPLKMRVTPTLYDYDVLTTPGVFVRFGERKTGRPFGGSVGRARAVIRRF